MASMLSLAPESRYQIYQQLIVHQEPINQRKRYEESPDLRNAQRNYLALSQTCRQIHNEVRYIFYGENVFSFDIFEWSEGKRSKHPDQCFLHYWKNISAVEADLSIPPMPHCRISVHPFMTVQRDFNRYVCVETICKWLSKACRVRRLDIFYESTSTISHISAIQRGAQGHYSLAPFIGLGLLGPFGKLTNVETFAIEGPVPTEYKENQYNRIQGYRLSWPLPDMYYSLQRYVTSYSMQPGPTAAYEVEDDFWQLSIALKFAAAGDLKEFKRHRRRVKKLGDLRHLDSSILYAYDPEDGTIR